MMEAPTIQNRDFCLYDKALRHGRVKEKLFALDVVVIFRSNIKSFTKFFLKGLKKSKLVLKIKMILFLLDGKKLFFSSHFVFDV